MSGMDDGVELTYCVYWTFPKQRPYPKGANATHPTTAQTPLRGKNIR